MVDFEGLLRALSGAGVDFIIIGGVAATAHGSARLTTDLDIVYSRAPENLERIVKALAPHAPYLRGAPPGLPFRLDIETMRAGLNFTLTTSLGPIDLIGEAAGGGSFPNLENRTIVLLLFGIECRCVDLDTLIRLKRAAGRPKDLETIAELELRREEQ
ncbi:MAG: nucleotidyl transferase AbiEii/AbiGii toxin family protein [Thermoanaerobaculia bacterium]